MSCYHNSTRNFYIEKLACSFFVNIDFVLVRKLLFLFDPCVQFHHLELAEIDNRKKEIQLTENAIDHGYHKYSFHSPY